MSSESYTGRPRGSQSLANRHIVVRLACGSNRAFSWGMPANERCEYLAETAADWEEMLAEKGAKRVAVRALAGIPAWLWARLSLRNTTTLPAALGVTLVALGGMAASLQPGAYSGRVRALMAVASIGLLLGSVELFRSPRQIVLRRFAIPALLAAVGTIGVGFEMPAVTAWEYETAALNNPMVDAMTQAGLLALGAGCAISAINGFLVARRRIAIVSGTLVVLGLGFIGVSQIIWGIWDTSVDLGLAVSSIMTGLAALSLVHVMPRLRNVEILEARTDSDRSLPTR